MSAVLRRRRFHACALVLALCLLFTAPTWAQTPVPTASPSPVPPVPSVNPYGPTVTTTATLTNVGIPEFETYAYVSRNLPSAVQLRQTPFLIKYTFNKRWQVNLGGPGFPSLMLPGGRQPSAFGDPVLGVKTLLVVPRDARQSTQALQLQYKFPVSDPSLGLSTGRADQQLTYFYSQDYGKVHLDVNLWMTNLGAPDGTRRVQLGQGVGVSVPLSPSVTAESEWHNYARAGEAVPAVSSFMEVLYINLDPRLTLAAGVDLGLTAATPRQTWIVGAIFHFGGARRSRPGPGQEP